MKFWLESDAKKQMPCTAIPNAQNWLLLSHVALMLSAHIAYKQPQV